MPAKRRRRKLQRRQFSRFDITRLLTGLDFGRDLVEVRQAWEGLKGLLLPRWVAANPGTRCWAWWQCSSPDRRRRVDGEIHPFDSDERRRLVAETDRKTPDVNFWEVAYRLDFGVPACWLTETDFGARYEPQSEFLARYGLLSGKERAALEDTSDNERPELYRFPAFTVERSELQFSDSDHVTFAREADGWDEDDDADFFSGRVPEGPGVDDSTAPGPLLTCNPLGAKDGSDDDRE